jgi:hypothetical protein
MRRWVGLTTVVGVLALAASALVVALVPRKHERVIPWTDALPTPVRYVPAAPQSARICTDSDVHLSAAEPMGVSSAESLYFVDVRNVSARSCFLEGRPRIDVPRRASGAISIADATGVDLPLPPPVPAGFPTKGARFGLASGTAARAGIAILHICRNRLDEREVRVRAGLPAGEKGVPLVVSACASSGTTLMVGPFAPPDQPVPAAHHWPLKISLDVPKSVQRGHRIDYLVRLTNAGAQPFRFPSGGLCPGFDQMITGSVDNPADTLNCRPMGTLAPGESAVFAMRIDPFPFPSAGSHSLIWHLADGTKSGITARQKLEIKP